MVLMTTRKKMKDFCFCLLFAFFIHIVQLVHVTSINAKTNTTSQHNNNIATHAVGNAVHVKIEELRDWRLCNNGLKPNKFYGDPDRKCFHRDKYEPCDDRQYNATTCRQGTLDLLGHNHKEYLHKIRALFEVADHDLSLRRLTLHFRRDMYQAISHTVDTILIPKPWWHIEQETFPWHLQDKMLMVIDRIDNKRELFLRWIADLYYPNETICKETPFWHGAQLGNHPGVATGISFYEGFYGTAKFLRIAIYVSISNRVQDDAEFATGLLCPNTMNKWECSFYPTSNCTLPDLITKCNSLECVQQASMNILSKHSTDGVVVKRDSPEFNAIVKRYESSGQSTRNEELYRQWSAVRPRYKYMLPYEQNNTWYINYLDDIVEYFMLDLFFTRPNANFRSLIEISLRDMEKKFNLRLSDYGHNDSCVAVHLRRGDRHAPSGNTTQYCLDRPTDFEKGCTGVPFGLVTMDHVIKRAESMVHPRVRTLFVATDDMAYLKSETERLQRSGSPWKIVYVPWIGPDNLDRTDGLTAAEKEQRYYQFRYRAGVLSGVQYFASIKALQKCEAFVGHSGSAVALMIIRTLCERYSSYEGICPPVYNFQRGL